MTFLFSLYGSYQRREIQVVTLQAAAGAPPSAVALLETYAMLGLVDRLPELFRDWERWAAEVLDSHVAYPLLGYFRSSHDNLSWISALGTVLDAASLVLTTIDGVPRGEAKLFKRWARTSSRTSPTSASARASRRTRSGGLRCRLRSARGGRVHPRAARPGVAGVRGGAGDVALRLEAMAAYWATPATSWLGDPVALRRRSTGRTIREARIAQAPSGRIGPA